MMTLAELQNAEINPLIAREAYDHAAKRLADALDTKKAFEQKAFTLFGGYLTISLALLGAGSAVYTNENLQYHALVAPLWATGAVFYCGRGVFPAGVDGQGLRGARQPSRHVAERWHH
jgi:hypothetical protein